MYFLTFRCKIKELMAAFIPIPDPNVALDVGKYAYKTDT